MGSKRRLQEREETTAKKLKRSLKAPQLIQASDYEESDAEKKPTQQSPLNTSKGTTGEGTESRKKKGKKDKKPKKEQHVKEETETADVIVESKNESGRKKTAVIHGVVSDGETTAPSSSASQMSTEETGVAGDTKVAAAVVGGPKESAEGETAGGEGEETAVGEPAVGEGAVGEPAVGEGEETAAVGEPAVGDFGEETAAVGEGETSFFVDVGFNELSGLCEPLVTALTEKMKLKLMTQIQAHSIPNLLSGRDVLGCAATGSGKTLSFLIPAFNMMYMLKVSCAQGTVCLIIAPTRELANQIDEVAKTIRESGNFTQTRYCITGGIDRGHEATILRRGQNLLVATPGRLLDHMQSTQGFNYANVCFLVIDEADRLLDDGFEKQMNQILAKLPSSNNRQTALFSATLSTRVEQLARLSLSRPVLIDVKSKKVSTAANIEQGYILCSADQRFLLLFALLKRNITKKKMMVFFSTCMSVHFHEQMLSYVDLPVLAIHGKKKQNARNKVFRDFINAKTGVLLCTDVAARGLDIPNVDWIVQYDPPGDPKEYIHRVGRTARGEGRSGKALLFLLKEELHFLFHLKQAKVPVSEYVFNENKIIKVQSQFERIVAKNHQINRSAHDAYRAYIHAYAAHSLKDVFDFNKLNLCEVARSFGFENPPKIDIAISLKRKKKKFNH